MKRLVPPAVVPFLTLGRPPVTTPDQSNGFQIVGAPDSREIATGVWAREISFREPIAHVLWSPDGRWLAVLTAHRELILLDQGLVRKRAVYESLGQIEAFCFDPNDAEALLVLLWDSRDDRLLILRISLSTDSFLQIRDHVGFDLLYEMQGFFPETTNLLQPLIPRLVKHGARIAMTDGVSHLACLTEDVKREMSRVDLGSAKVAEVLFSPWNPDELLVATPRGLQVWNCTGDGKLLLEDETLGPFPLLASGRGTTPTPVV
ncbi:MAG: hypothetical protein ACK5EA_07005, partial [Planctomycetaceae bacterium]